MSESISVQCPQCSARLKLKNRSAVGKKVPCPKCKKPFVVELPPDDDEFAEVMEADAFETADDADEGEEFSRLPPTRTSRQESKKTPKKRRAGSGQWKKPALVAGIVIVLLGLLGGAGIVVAPLIGDLLSRNKIDMTWLPPDADTVAHVRVADTWNSPFVKSLMSSPLAAGLMNVKETLGLEPPEIKSLTMGAIAAAPRTMIQGGPPGIGMNPAGAGMPMMVGPAGGRSAILVLRTVQSFEPKEMQTKLRMTRTVPYQNQELIYVGGVAMAGQVCFLPDNRTIVMGQESDIKAAIDRGPKNVRREDLDFIDSGRHVVIVVAPKDPSTFESTTPASPFSLPGVSTLGNTMKGKVKGICFGLAFGEDLDWSASANCTTAEAAKEASAEMTKSLDNAKASLNNVRSTVPPQFSEMVTLADGILNSITVQTHGGVLEGKGKVAGSVTKSIDKLPMLMLAGAFGGGPGANFAPGNKGPGGFPVSQGGGGFNLDDTASPEKSASDPAAPGQVNFDPLASSREAAQRARCMNNLKQIGLAMFNHHDAKGQFPASAIVDTQGKPLLSWRVAVLPYLGEEALYKEFHLGEAWDGEHNKKLLARMPPVFTCSDSKAGPGMTSYLAATGPGAILEGTAGRKIADVTDGTSNTILIVEADDSRAIPWTKPDDYVYDAANPIKGLIGHHPGGFLALTCDGAAHFFAETLDPKVLVALFTRSGSESIPDGVVK